VRATWDEAFAAIGSKLKAIPAKAMTFYASGKAALEPSYLYAVWARALGHNNLPDSSNMCHETTSVGLKKVIGSPVGTCQLEDLEQCDAIFYLGQNPGTNSPRILHPLQQAVKRGCKIVTFNPLKEAGLVEFVNPQSPLEMLTGKATRLSHLYLQVRPGGDIAALMGVCKHVLARAEREQACSTRILLRSIPMALPRSAPSWMRPAGTRWKRQAASPAPRWKRPAMSTPMPRRSSASMAWA
jgi:anaerobic selenocysteine-containing dehydrogenase